MAVLSQSTTYFKIGRCVCVSLNYAPKLFYATIGEVQERLVSYMTATVEMLWSALHRSIPFCGSAWISEQNNTKQQIHEKQMHHVQTDATD